MAGQRRSVLWEGVVAGVIGATVVAVWFLVFDLVKGRPFFTPGLLGALAFTGVTDPEAFTPALGPILGYTFLHGLAFIGFGIVAAAIIAASEHEPTLFIGFVILFACFEAFFFGVVGAIAQDVIGALVWWAVLVANILATLAMVAYFFRGHRALPGALFGSWTRVLREGVVAGLIGAVTVAVWFLAIDWINGQPLRTPELLGQGFLGLEGTEAVLAYTAVHGVAFLAFGIVGAALIAGAERQPLLLFGLIILFTSFEIFFFGATVIAASWVLDYLAGWAIFVGNILAATAMLAYYLSEHRTLPGRLRTAWAEED